MQEFMDYTIQQPLNHRHSSSSINTSSSPGSVFTQPSPSVTNMAISPSVNNMAISPLEIMSFEQQQQRQFEYMAKITNQAMPAMPPTPGEMPTGYPFMPDDDNNQKRHNHKTMPIKQEREATPLAEPAPPPKRKRAARRRLTVNQKIAHNKIEKKYRTNINEKIFGLDDLIAPSFRFESSSDEGFEEDWTQTTTGSSQNGTDGRPNKSKILERAASYIKYLKLSNSQLRERTTALEYRLTQYE